MKSNVLQAILGWVLLILTLVLGATLLASKALFFRLLIGIAFGYALTRAYMGFAGSVNRAYNTGSTKLFRTLAFMFFITAVMVAGFLMLTESTDYNLWVNPINFGLILGGLLFGFGMTFSTCCASGVLTDLIGEFPKALVTLVFFCIGVFIGFPIQNSATWVQKTWLRSASYENGVFFPDWFKGDPLGGYLGAIILTGVLCLGVVGLSFAYERYRKNKNTLYAVPSERLQDNTQPLDTAAFKLFSKDTYTALFAKPWKMSTGAVVIAITFVVLMAVTKAGWGASTPYGLWFGKILMVFGVSSESLASFAKMGAAGFETPFFQHAVSVQNFGIILGALFFMLMSSQLFEAVKSAFKLKWWQLLLFAMGGLTMGFGTRLANGCNVGALYTPIANFSLAGWLFFIFLALGGVAGNIIQKKIYDKASGGK